MSLNTSGSVNFQNPNQTSLTISGVVGEQYYNGTNITVQTFQPLSGASVYLYMGKDMNYVDANGQIIGPQQAQLCAFGSPTSPYLPTGAQFPTTCTPADPMWTGRQAGAQNVSFSVPSSCGPPPQSLLNTKKNNCNIYGAFSLPSLCPSQGSTQPYCIPSYVNGTGTCTSQYGFMGTATTNANGIFTYTTNACGIGQVYVEAAYYGDTQQPLTVLQSPLVGSANSIIGAFPASPVAFNAINYNWAPNVTSTVASIGLFELGFGSLSAIGIVAIAVVAVSIILYKRHKANTARSSASGKNSSSKKRKN